MPRTWRDLRESNRHKWTSRRQRPERSHHRCKLWRQRSRARGRKTSQKSENWAIDKPKEQVPDGELEQRGKQHTRAESADTAECHVILLNLHGYGGKQGEEERQGGHRGGLYIGDRSTPADRWLRLERIGRNSENEHGESRPGPLQAALTKLHLQSEEDGKTAGAKKGQWVDQDQVATCDPSCEECTLRRRSSIARWDTRAKACRGSPIWASWRDAANATSLHGEYHALGKQENASSAKMRGKEELRS